VGDFSLVMEKAGIPLTGLVWDLVQLRCVESFPLFSVGLSIVVICGTLGCDVQVLGIAVVMAAVR